MTYNCIKHSSFRPKVEIKRLRAFCVRAIRGVCLKHDGNNIQILP